MVVLNYCFFCVVVCVFLKLQEIRCGDAERQIWYTLARRAIEQRLRGANTDIYAKNVVLVIGDGMGPNTVTAARILRGQRLRRSGEDMDLAWDTFPAMAMAKTYNADAQVGESSACATALSSGVKANHETLGLDSAAKFQDCFSSYESRVSSILTWAQQEGKATGIVTTTRVTHATPAAFYAHASSRYWEDDSKIPSTSRRLCKDIARQLVEDEPGRNLNVILGGGRRHFVSTITSDPEASQKMGRRLDGRNLITDWIRDKKYQNQNAEYVTSQRELNNVDTQNTDFLLGLFSYSHMDFNIDRDRSPAGDPSISEMTKVALKILEKQDKGFFLLIEGGRIDHAHHYNNAFRALDETLALEEAVNIVLDHVDLTETLIVVTADHSDVLTFGGYGTARGNPIFGHDTKLSDIDNLSYTTLVYGSGPGYNNPRTTKLSQAKYRDMLQNAAFPRIWAAHGGGDVQVFALGPLDTTIFSGTFDQSFIPHAIAYVSCLGEYKQRCRCLNGLCHGGKVSNDTEMCVDEGQDVCDEDEDEGDEEIDNRVSGEFISVDQFYLVDNKAAVCKVVNLLHIFILFCIIHIFK